ncbi:MAG: septum formation protein Maf [Candidatus Hydrogenedentota bacterium]|nr:MAG: septum formation protein Maf [Candidatus Hydrogenedentota bacterium]
MKRQGAAMSADSRPKRDGVDQRAILRRGARLVLASRSPRRISFLAAMGYQFDCVPTRLDESAILRREETRMSPEELCLVVAREKACSARKLSPTPVILAADTMVVLDKKILGIPATPEAARRMLSALSGRIHSVLTGVVVLGENTEQTHLGKAVLRFRDLTDEEMEEYVSGGEGMDKAGGYAFQGRARAFVAEYAGDPDVIIGLPRRAVREMLSREGIHPQDGGEDG